MLVPIGGMDSEGCRMGRKILASEGSSELLFLWRFTPAQEKARRHFQDLFVTFKKAINNHDPKATQLFY